MLTQSDGFLDLMALQVRDIWTSLGAKVGRIGFARLADVAPRVLAFRAMPAHQDSWQERLGRWD
jgi:hypothetical protein